MKKTHFTGTLVDQFRLEFEDLVKDFEEKHGIKISLGNIRYSLRQLKSNMTVTIVKDGEDPEAVEGKLNLKRYGYKFGLSEDDFNKRINYLGRVFKLKGIKPRSHKYPIIAEDVNDGKSYKLPTTCLRGDLDF